MVEHTSVAPFEFATAARIIFGDDRLNDLGVLASSFGRRVFLVTGKRAVHAGRVRKLLARHGCESSTYIVSGEPTVSLVDAGAAQAREWKPDVVVAVGGGSVVDAGKAIAGLVTNGGMTADYLEGVGRGLVIEKPALPMIAVPTTAGTGSEVTKNAVITDDGRTFKKSMRSEHLLPRIALVDPELTRTMPPEVTAYSGLDALTQLIEAYTSNRASPLTDAIAEKGIARAARSLMRAYEDGEHIEARRDMALAALFGGMALANAGLGAVHGMASPLGAFYPAPHGAVCAALLPHVVAVNIRRLREEEPAHPTLEKYRRIAEMLCPDAEHPLEALPARLHEMVAHMHIPGLGEWGLTREDIPRVVARSRGSSMRYNPVVLSDDELTDILNAAL